jgi:hypothetical protein
LAPESMAAVAVTADGVLQALAAVVADVSDQ